MPLRPIPRPKAPRVGRTPGKFTQSRRLDHLRSQLEAHTAGLTLEDMAGLLRASTRTIRRYLRELSLVTEVEAIPIGPGEANLWRIKPSERGRTVTLRRGQAYGLLAPRRVFEVLRGSALFDEIDLAMRQVEQVAHRPTARTGVRGDVPAQAAARGSVRLRAAVGPRLREPQRGHRRGVPGGGRHRRAALPVPGAPGRTARARASPPTRTRSSCTAGPSRASPTTSIARRRAPSCSIA